VDNLITAMDLTQPGEEDDEVIERLKPKTLLNPHLQRLYQCLEHRALNPDSELPDISTIITQYLQPPIKATEVVCELQGKFTLRPNEKKTKRSAVAAAVFGDADDASGAVDDASAAKQPAVGDVTKLSDLTSSAVSAVSSISPVEDFHTIINKKILPFNTACDQLQKVVLQFVINMIDSSMHSKAMDCLMALRKEAVKVNADQFNTFLTSLKDSCRRGKPAEFWDRVKNDKVTLITSTESTSGGVSKEEAERFHQEQEAPAEPELPEEEDENLLAMMD
jgi:ATP-dependent DNA helicase 2 subunit 2